jgi:hypothetical protein
MAQRPASRFTEINQNEMKAPRQRSRPPRRGNSFTYIATELNNVNLHHPRKRFQHPDLFDWLAEQDCRVADSTVRWVSCRGRVPLSTAQTIAELAGFKTWERR